MNWKPIKSVDYLVIHCAATKPKQDIGVEEIRKWHRERGWIDVGYHYVITRSGALQYGRPIDRPGAHARGFNHVSIGVCLVGGIDDQGKPDDNFTDEQWDTLSQLVTELKESFPDAEVLGHRDLPNVRKACPSFDVSAWWTTVEENNNESENTNTAAPEEGQVVDGTRSCVFVQGTRPPEEDQ